jgi:Flp pilus assembly protein TadD/YHS domain-containing protein
MPQAFLRRWRWTVLAVGAAGCAGPDFKHASDGGPLAPRIVLVSSAGGSTTAVSTPQGTDRDSSGSIAATLAATRAAAVSTDYAAAVKHDAAGQLQEARDAYQRVLRRQPRRVDVLHRLAVVCTRLADYDAARRYFERALSHAPDNPSLLADFGYSQYLAGDRVRAEELLRQAVQLAPDDERAANNLAIVLGMTARYDESLSLFQRFNSPAKAWINLGQLHRARGEAAEELQCYRRAQELDSTIRPPQLAAAQGDARPQSPRETTSPAPIAASSAVNEMERSAPTKLSIAAPHVSAVPRLEAPTTVAVAPSFAPPPLPVITPAEVPAREVEPETKVEHPRFEPPVVAGDPQPSQRIALEKLLPEASEPTPNRDDAVVVFEPPVLVAPRPERRERGPAASDPEPASDQLFEAPLVNAMGPQTGPIQLAGLSTADAFESYCLVTLCDERRLVSASTEHSIVFKGRKYCFASAEHVRRFLNAPRCYAPAADGVDVVAHRRGEGIFEGRPEYGVWYRDRLYLFSSQRHKDAFCADVRAFVITAN